MATVIMGSARHDENGKLTGGKLGDQKQSSTNDFKGEVSMQYLKDFVGSRKWYVIRPKQAKHARTIAQAMKTLCNNIHVGYDQGNRLGIIKYGVDTTTNTECDCSSGTRACIIKGTGKDPGNYTTADEVSVLAKTGLFDKAIPYKTGMTIYEGDVFVTQTKGHTGIAIEGASRGESVSTNFIYQGVDFSKVFDPVFYAEKNPDIKKALGTNPTVLFNHFITCGCNEKSRWGKTISTFNVEVYEAHNADLRNAFGPIDKNTGANGYPYYKHYCTNGYNENRRII
jgi:hypothetical protein